MTLLLLAGTSEATAIAKALAQSGHLAVASLAGATRQPKELPLRTRIGGFGGAEGFEAYLQENAITAVLDATHPFADQISHRSARICAEIGIPYCQVLRPKWQPTKGDKWVMVGHETEVAHHIPDCSRVFLATGRQTLHHFANMSQRYLICRQIDQPDGPFPLNHGEYLIGRPPFSVEDETELFQRLQVDWLVVKNAGGAASSTKLIAARHLGLPVAMITRPKQPDALQVETVQDALAWVQNL